MILAALDFGSFEFTPDGVATVLAGFVLAGLVIGLLGSVLVAFLRSIEF